MGAFTDRGLEYRAVMRDGRYAVLAPIAETDRQLVESQYYNERKSTWFSRYPASAVRLSPELVTDMRLSAGQSDLLARVLRVQDVVEHGWWDVAYTGSSLGRR